MAVAAFAASACEAGNFASPVALSTAVITLVDSGPPLQSARTFALPDTIVELPVGAATISHRFDRTITTTVRTHLVSLGWRDTGIDPAARPDVLVLVAASTRVQTGLTYSDWFGAWGYLPYWGAGVDPSSPWGLPAGAIPYVYQAGTLLVAMIDLRTDRAHAHRIPLLWGAAVDGVLADPAANAQRAIQGIDQAFAQSPYLQVQ
jgi:hypothetical protein